MEGLSPELFAMMAECAMPVTFDAGRTIFHEGEPANRFYLLLEGAVALQARLANQGVALVTTLRSGDVLGWSWLFPPYTWHFDAVAIEASRATFFYGTWLRQLGEEHPQLGYELMRRMAEVLMRRLQATRQQWLATAHLPGAVKRSVGHPA